MYLDWYDDFDSILVWSLAFLDLEKLCIDFMDLRERPDENLGWMKPKRLGLKFSCLPYLIIRFLFNHNLVVY